MPSPQSTLAEVIGAIGETDFAAVAADSLRQFVAFDLTAVVVHRRQAAAAVMFDNFDRVGSRQGIENYVRFTHSINPMLACAPSRAAVRARDFAIPSELGQGVEAYLVRSPDEEMGFRTVGWPERMEEIGLYFEACGGVVELGFYRERARRSAPGRKLRELEALSAPIAAAFERHGVLGKAVAGPAGAPLSPREREIVDLLLRGCSSEAIALRLNISRHTVKDHRKQIFRKLRIGSLAELFALRLSPSLGG